VLRPQQNDLKADYTRYATKQSQSLIKFEGHALLTPLQIIVLRCHISKVLDTSGGHFNSLPPLRKLVYATNAMTRNRRKSDYGLEPNT